MTDGLQDMALSFEKGNQDIMLEQPRKTNQSLFSKDLMLEVMIFGLSISFMIFVVWKYLMDHNIDLIASRSIIMLMMVFVQNIHVLNCRSEKNSVFTTPIFSNYYVIITIVGSILLQFIVMNVPFLSSFLKITNLKYDVILSIFVFSCMILVISEIYKFIYRYLAKK